jgi:hypothetical protein
MGAVEMQSVVLKEIGFVTRLLLEDTVLLKGVKQTLVQRRQFVSVLARKVLSERAIFA